MTHPCRRGSCAMLSIAALCLGTATRQPIERLEPGRAVDDHLAPGTARAYEVRAARGDFLHVAVEPRHLDIEVRLLQSDGRLVVSIENALQEEDVLSVSAIAAADDVYRVEVKSGSKQRSAGRYRVTLDALRPSSAADERHVAGDRAYGEAVGLRARGTADAMRTARDRLGEALAIWREIGDRREEGRTLLQTTEVIFRLGDVRGALEASEAALKIARELNDPQQTVAALNNAAVCLNTMGDPAGALEYYKEALPLQRSVGDRVNEGNVLNNIGRAYSVLGDHRQALQYLEEALPVRVETGDRLGQAITLNNLGLERSALGQPERARDYHEQALKLYREAGDLRGASGALNNAALAYNAIGDWSRARANLLEALALDRQTGDERLQGNHLYNIAATYAGERRWTEARDYYSQALPLRQKTGDRAGEAFTLGRLGATYVETGDFDRAAALLTEALRLADSIGDSQGRALALYHLARVDRAQGRDAEAVDRLQMLLDWFESVRSLVPGPDLRASYFATARFAHELLIETLLDLDRRQPHAGFDVRAFETSERARARSMLDLLAESQADIHQGVDRTLVERERGVRAQLASRVDRRIRAAGAGAGSADLTRQDADIDALVDRLDAIRAELRTRSPQFAALTEPRPLTLAEVQAQVLDDDSVLFEYSLGETRSALWVVTRTAVSVFELPPREAIERLARQAYADVSALGAPQTGAPAALARVVFPTDLTPFASKRLLIVADGALQYVPFAALPTRAGSPLAVTNEVVSLPSASTLALLRRESAGRAAATGAVAVLADPVFDAADSRVAGAARTGPAEAQGEGLLRSASESGLSAFDRLASSREEADAIAALAGRGRALVALDFDASRDLVLSGRLESFRIVHFATHGLLDSRRPELSGLVLSLVDRRGRRVNGFLQLNDIYNLKLRADLVVLSACRTALGQDIRGEGLIGMTRAFMYAGAPRVVASLWAVPNRATAELMKRFYTHVLVDRMAPAAALRRAQLDLRKTPRWAAPFFWAGFVLEGEPN